MIISKSEIKKVSYIKCDSLDDRAIPLHACYLGDSEWVLWIPTENGLVAMKPLGVAEACYFSKEPAELEDVYIDFVNLIMKRAYFKDVAHFENGIVEDIKNLATSIIKINFFHDVWRHDNKKIDKRFVTTELEYIFKVCRSLFDLLQEVISKIWARFRYLDPNLKAKSLQSTFSKMVLKENKLSTSEEIEERYSLPPELADFYHRNGKFFQWLRAYRDKISHGGNNIESLYILDEGFAVSTEVEPFDGLEIWEKTELKANKLGSVRALVSYTVLNTLHALEDFSMVIQSIMQLPQDIAPDHRVFIRGNNLSVFHELYKYVDGLEWIKK